jgi:exosortase family protein XrtF
LKKYFVLYKPFLLFLATFFGAYIFLSLCYQFFLNGFESNKTDSITSIVARNTDFVLTLFYNSVRVEGVVNEPFYSVYLQNKSVARIVEGCNGISVIILFISFVIAFSGSFKNTLLFVFGGSLLIYILNVLRIAALTVLLYYFPKQVHLLHGVLFPLIIYGAVFVLWVIWINKFSKYAK